MGRPGSRLPRSFHQPHPMLGLRSPKRRKVSIRGPDCGASEAASQVGMGLPRKVTLGKLELMQIPASQGHPRGSSKAPEWADYGADIALLFALLCRRLTSSVRNRVRLESGKNKLPVVGGHEEGAQGDATYSQGSIRRCHPSSSCDATEANWQWDKGIVPRMQ